MVQSASIRPAVEHDAESIARLAGTLGYSTTKETMRERLGAILRLHTELMIVAVDASGQVMGWLQAHASHVIESGFRVEIVGLIVAPESRRAGVGKLLVEHAERWAKSLGAPAIVVRSNVQRVESHAFYPALGYAATKTQNVYRKTL
jgi:GNAT superfamily N-acetyltransferase